MNLIVRIYAQETFAVKGIYYFYVYEPNFHHC